MSRSASRLITALASLGIVASLGLVWERLDESALRFPPGHAPTWSGRAWEVDLDSASEDELQALPGVGPRLAQRIVADRQSRGAFGTLEALDRVPGVGPSMIERLRPHVRTARAAATVVGHGG